MILRRLAEAIRNQSWFTIAIEFLIVVAGIFVGLQVDGWNQQRLEREHDQRALALFVDELEEMMNEAGVDLRIATTSVQELAAGTEIALRCDATTEERARLTAAIGNTLDWRVPEVRPSGLAEISNSGTLARLGNPALSRAVGRIHQGVKMISDSMVLIGPQYHQAFEMLLPYLVLTAPIQLEMLDVGVAREAPSEYMSLAPQETLCRTQEFLLGLSLLTSFYESNVYNFGEWQRSLKAARELAVEEMH